jgi:uncharacterized protein YdhG (YjbR/CyaY superfamily)
MVTKKKPETISEYIKGFPLEIQRLLQQVRRAIKEAAPRQAQEAITYGIPTFRLNNRYLVYFSGNKKHIGLYPVAKSMAKTPKERSYFASKGTFRFPLDEPMPIGFIKRTVRALAKANEAKAKKH